VVRVAEAADVEAGDERIAAAEMGGDGVEDEGVEQGEREGDEVEADLEEEQEDSGDLEEEQLGRQTGVEDRAAERGVERRPPGFDGQDFSLPALLMEKPGRCRAGAAGR
jgi:hypothetical protein